MSQGRGYSRNGIQIYAHVDLDISPSALTGHAFFCGDVQFETVGRERASFTSPVSAAGAKGIRLGNSSDFSVTRRDPVLMMQSAMLRITLSGVVPGTDRHVDALTALKALTPDVAWHDREDDMKCYPRAANGSCKLECNTASVSRLSDLPDVLSERY